MKKYQHLQTVIMPLFLCELLKMYAFLFYAIGHQAT